MYVIEYIIIVAIFYFAYRATTIIKVDKDKSLFQFFKEYKVSLSIAYRIVAYSLVVVFISIVLKMIDGNSKDFISLLAPLGIILSASIASLSVLKSIENTNRLEKEKKKKELELFKNKSIIYLLEINRFIFLYHSAYLAIKKISQEHLHTNMTIKGIKDAVFKDLLFVKELIIKDTDFISSYDGKKISKVLRTLTSIEMFFEKFDDMNDSEIFLLSNNDELLTTNFVLRELIILINNIKDELGLDIDTELNRVLNNIDALETLNPKELNGMYKKGK